MTARTYTAYQKIKARFKEMNVVQIKPEWLTTPVKELAKAFIDTKDASLLPILADALEDADCIDNFILTTLRGDNNIFKTKFNQMTIVNRIVLWNFFKKIPEYRAY